MPKPSNRPRAKRQKSMQPTYKKAGQMSGLEYRTAGNLGNEWKRNRNKPAKPTGRARRLAKKR